MGAINYSSAITQSNQFKFNTLLHLFNAYSIVKSHLAYLIRVSCNSITNNVKTECK